MSTVLLVGNGLSISYNRALAMPSLTTRVLDAFDRGAGTDSQILRDFARRAGADEDGLEAVLGALDQMSAALPILQRLSGIIALGRASRNSLSKAAEVLSEMYRVGLGHSLEVIDALAHGRPTGLAATEALLNAIPDPHELTIATLNYDGILPSRLLDGAGRHYDLAAGFAPGEHHVVDHEPPIRGFQLRDSDTLLMPALVNLHGSLGWLYHFDEGWWRFSVHDLRVQNYWRALRDSRTDWLPSVVLTNQDRKSEVVLRYPFTLAYQTFRTRLATASRFGVIGYGFGDEYLNTVIAEELRNRPRLPILVVTHGNGLRPRRIREAIEWPRPKPLRILRDGVEQAVVSSEWTRWATTGSP